ncbi:ribosome maturation factor RimM [Mangrovitalea sediminis]|uniref:ribosome maturation factor RimM n=1 Tax=Mangrovitalea sediminis TaxID=1982043 RepID=UPI000BE51AB6|nr:ribosome maturation factor RimM [Mangrovitalea sediminis]
MSQAEQETVFGRVTSVFGVKGWVKIYSYTDPMENLLEYKRWELRFPDGRRQQVKVIEGRRHGPGLVARLAEVDDRDKARLLCGAEIVVPISSLPPLPEGEYYWHQLEGLSVETLGGQRLGVVDHLMETGSNDVLVVRGDAGSIDDRERLIPYLPSDVVKAVDLAAGKLVVDWDAEF